MISAIPVFYSDEMIATAILDRVLHDAITLNIRGNSYRLKEKLKAGLIRAEEPAPIKIPTLELNDASQSLIRQPRGIPANPTMFVKAAQPMITLPSPVMMPAPLLRWAVQFLIVECLFA